MELDGGVSRVTGLLDTLAAADRMQAAAAQARADALRAGASQGVNKKSCSPCPGQNGCVGNGMKAADALLAGAPKAACCIPL